MKTLQLSILSVIVSLLCSNLCATNYYVTVTGAGNNTGVSWANATTLDAALALVIDGDIINIGAGSYLPAVNVTNGASTIQDKTFELKKNISLIGGYPDTPVEGSIPSTTNITKFDGSLTCNHVITVTAPIVADKKVTLTNISVTGGKSGSTTGTISINSLTYNRINGSAISIGAANVEMNNCHIFDNLGSATPGVHCFAASNVVFNNCVIENNTGTGNGGGIWNEVSTVYVNNSTINNNKITGVGGGVYAINSTASTTSGIPQTYLFNTTISNNTASHKAGYYGREKSVGVMVNCTIYGNACTIATGNTGGGVSLYTGTTGNAANPVSLDIINSTITNNSSVATLDDGGGIRVNDAYCTLNIYNSIVSGNTVGVDGSLRAGDIALLNSSVYNKTNTIVSDRVYSAYGTEIIGKTFDFVSMLGGLTDNGGSTKTCQLLGDNNPAKAYGMTILALKALCPMFTPSLNESLVTNDQLGNSRTGNIIGAWTSNKAVSGFINQSIQKPVVYINNKKLCIKTEINDRIAVYTITGKRILQTCATGNLTKTDNLTKGNVYVVVVNGRSTTIVY